MQQYNLVIEPKLIKEVDKLIAKYGLYSSRSDFIRDAIRARLIELKRMIAEESAEDEGHEEMEPAVHEFARQLAREHDERKYAGVH